MDRLTDSERAAGEDGTPTKPLCPRCARPSDLIPGDWLCWMCNTFQVEAEDEELRPRDWRIGKRVAVKYRTDPRFGTLGAVAYANGDRLKIRLDDGTLIEDDQDNWRTA